MLLRRTPLLLFAALLLVRPGAPGLPLAEGLGVAGSPPPTPRSPIERATVELVLIEAYVSDAKGRPIPGLGTDDFVLLVDGHVKPITSVEFREIVRGTTTPAPPETAGAPVEPRAVPPAPAYPRRLVLFFDDATSAPQGQAVARRAAEDLLGTRLDPADQVALVSYDRRLRVLHDFTTDRTALRRTLEESLNDPQRHSDFASELRQRQEEIHRLIRAGGPSQRGFQEASVVVGRYAVEDAVRLRAILSSLRSLVDGLAPWPGYKGIVFMGDGIPENPGQVYLDRLVTPEAGYEEKDNLSLELKALAHAASAAGVTLHSVQTSGLVAGGPGEVRNASRRANSLESLASATGGTASTSNDLLHGLEQAEAQSRAYYIIGYTPSGPPDGQDHTVQLRVRGGGTRMRWRHTFTRLQPSEARTRTIEAAHLLPEFYRELGVDLTAVAGPVNGGMQVTDLVLHLPRDRVLFLPESGRPTAHLEIGIVALDGSGREALRLARQAVIALRADLKADIGTGLNFFCRVRLPTGPLRLTAVVSDLAGGATGAARLDLPAVDIQRDILGLSIYSLSEKSLWVEVDTVAEKETGRPLDYTLGPALKSVFAPGEPLACGFRAPGPGGAGPPALRLMIRQGSRTVRTVELPPVAPGGSGTVKATLPVEGLADDDYLLVVQRADSGSESAAAALPFRIGS
jgi:VWFA-related protein